MKLACIDAEDNPKIDVAHKKLRFAQMLKALRGLNFAWKLILIGIAAEVSEISNTAPAYGEKTLVCFDIGCIYRQGISNGVIGGLAVAIGIYLILKKR